MNTIKINGDLYKIIVTNGAVSLRNAYKEIDALNVFPVPDGDTGTNMSMTMSAAVAELKRLGDKANASEVASVTASAAMKLSCCN